MIAKLSVWGKNRFEAIQRGRAALNDTVLNGIKTNIPLHLQILDNAKFNEGNYTTRFIGDDFQYQIPTPPFEEVKMAMIAAAVSAYQKEYKSGNGLTEEESQWRALGRKEALQR
jgi:acetyl-CoA carboxylase biotin carboxylase subunit